MGALHVEGALLECLLHLVPWVPGLQVGGELVKVCDINYNLGAPAI